MPVIVGRFLPTRQERQRLRGLLGPLRLLQISGRSRERYRRVATRFALDMVARGGLAETLEDLEAQLALYVEEMWEAGDSRADASTLVAAVQFFIRRRKRFHEAWALIGIWCRNEVPFRVPPLPAEVVLALAGIAARDGRLDYLTAIILGFHTFLRTIELSQIRAGQFAVGPTGVGVIGLQWTKGGQRRGAQENVTIDEGLVGLWLLRVSRGLLPGDLVLRSSLEAFRRWFAQSLNELGLGGCGFTVYSLRRRGDLLLSLDRQPAGYDAPGTLGADPYG